MGEEKNKPQETYRAGTVTLTVWKNKVKDQKGNERDMLSFQLNKRYKDKDEWKDSKSLNIGDLPKVAALMNKAYYDAITKGKDDE